MPRLRPEVLFVDGKLDVDAWYAEIGEGACCEGEMCYTGAGGQAQAISPLAARAVDPRKGASEAAETCDRAVWRRDAERIASLSSATVPPALRQVSD